MGSKGYAHHSECVVGFKWGTHAKASQTEHVKMWFGVRWACDPSLVGGVGGKITDQASPPVKNTRSYLERLTKGKRAEDMVQFWTAKKV